jgi:hypothetical protein
VDALIAIAIGLPFFVLVTLVLGAPIIFFMVRRLRKDPANARRRALIPAALNGAASGFVLGATGFIFGAGIGDESAGTIASVLGGGGCFGGLFIGTGVTWAAIVYLSGSKKSTAAPLSLTTAPPAEDVAAAERRSKRVLTVCIATLVLGTISSVAGFGLSLSLGALSLAVAQAIVRPLGILFVVLHGLELAVAMRAVSNAGSSDLATGRARTAVMISVAGALLALLIAIAGPAAYEKLMEGAVRSMGAVH